MKNLEASLDFTKKSSYVYVSTFNFFNFNFFSYNSSTNSVLLLIVKLLFATRWKTRKRQRGGFIRHIVGRPSSKLAAVVGVIAASQP